MTSRDDALLDVSNVERDPDTAAPLRAILGYTPDEPGRYCQNLDASTYPARPPCVGNGQPAPAHWVTTRHHRHQRYLCDACVPRCVHDGLPRHAYDHIASLAVVGWQALVVEATRDGLAAIEILATNPAAGHAEPPPDVQAWLRRYVYWHNAWVVEYDQLRGLGIIDDDDPTAPFGVHTSIDRGLFPRRTTRRAYPLVSGSRVTL